MRWFSFCSNVHLMMQCIQDNMLCSAVVSKFYPLIPKEFSNFLSVIYHSDFPWYGSVSLANFSHHLCADEEGNYFHHQVYYHLFGEGCPPFILHEGRGCVPVFSWWVAKIICGKANSKGAFCSMTCVAFSIKSPGATVMVGYHAVCSWWLIFLFVKCL